MFTKWWQEMCSIAKNTFYSVWLLQIGNFRARFVQNWLTPSWKPHSSTCKIGNASVLSRNLSISKSIIFPEFWAKILGIAHPTNYSYLPPWFFCHTKWLKTILWRNGRSAVDRITFPLFLLHCKKKKKKKLP